MKFAVLSPGFPMYKCRENAKLFHFTKDEMCNIPYDKRNLDQILFLAVLEGRPLL